MKIKKMDGIVFIGCCQMKKNIDSPNDDGYDGYGSVLD
jgi:hypothetical protein